MALSFSTVQVPVSLESAHSNPLSSVDEEQRAKQERSEHGVQGCKFLCQDTLSEPRVG